MFVIARAIVRAVVVVSRGELKKTLWAGTAQRVFFPN